MDIVTAFKKIKEDESLCARRWKVTGNSNAYYYYEAGILRVVSYERFGGYREAANANPTFTVKHIIADWEVLPIANLTS